MGSHTSNDDYEKERWSVEIVVTNQFFGKHYNCDHDGCMARSQVWYGLAGYSLSACVGYCLTHARYNALANMINDARESG